jgi:hypothetical protein
MRRQEVQISSADLRARELGVRVLPDLGAFFQLFLGVGTMAKWVSESLEVLTSDAYWTAIAAPR